MTGIRARILGAITALLTGVGPAAAQQSTPFSDVQQDAIHALILDTIRENPEVIIDSIMAYQEQVAAETENRRRAAIADLRNELQSDQNAGSLGNPDGGTVIVEFFDYNCPYCRRAAPEVNALIDEDPDLRVVMREFPILGPDSETAARASLAARAQGKYAEFHDALMAQPRANAATIRRTANEVGLDFERLQADMRAPEVDEHIARSRELAQQLGISGTPTFIIGGNLVPGFAKQDQLAAMIAEARDLSGEP